MSYNPYLQALQGAYNQPSAQMQNGQVTPEDLQAQLQANQQLVQKNYIQPALNHSNQVSQMAEGLGTSVGSQLAQVNDVWNNPYTQSSQERLRNRTQEARERNAIRLGDEEARRASIEDGMKIAAGADPTKVRQEREDINKFKEQASDEQRIENYETFKQNQSAAHQDFELMRDIMFASPEDVKSKYQSRPQLLDYILGQKDQRKVNALQAAAYNDVSSDTIFNGWNALGATVAGVGENVGGYTDLYNLATLEGQDRIDALNNGITSKLSDIGDSLQNPSAKASDTRAAAREQYEKDAGSLAYATAIEQGDSKELAETRAELARTGESVNSLLDNPYQITKEVAQFVPDMVTSLVAGGAIAKGASALGKSALEKAAKHFDNSLAKRVRNEAIQKAIIEGKTEGLEEIGEQAAQKAKQEFMDKAQKEIAAQVENRTRLGVAGFEMANNAMQNAPQGYQTASQNIMAMPLDNLKQTQGFKDTQAQYPELSDEEVQIKMADEAGLKGYGYAAGTSAAAGLLGSQVEANLVLGRARALKKKLSETLTNAGEEAIEEGGSVVAGNLATNKETKEQSVGVYKDAGKSAVIGALASGVTTGAVSIPSGLKSSLSAISKPVLEKVVTSQEQKINNQSADDVNTFYNGKTTKDEKGNTSTTKPIFDGSYEKSAIKESVDAHAKDFDDLNINHSQDIGSIISDLSLKERKATKAKDTDTLDKINKIKNSLYDGILRDTGTTSEEYKDTENLVQDVTKLYQEKDIDGLKTIFGLNEDSTDKDLGEAILKFAQDSESKLIELSKNTESYKALQETPLVKYLSGQTNGYNTNPFKAKPINLFEGVKPIPSAQMSKNIGEIQNKLQNNTISKEDAAKSLAQSLRSFTENFYKKSAIDTQDIKSIQDLFESSKDLFHTLDLSDVYNDFHTLLHKHDLTDPVNKDIFLGGIDGAGNFQNGLMTYLLDAMTNNGKLSTRSLAHLQHFRNTQTLKNLGVLKAIQELVANDEKKPVELRNLALKSEDKRVISRITGEPVTFKTVAKGSEYLRKVNSNLQEFNRITDKLLGLKGNKPDTASNNKNTGNTDSVDNTIGNTETNSNISSNNTNDENTKKIDTPEDKTTEKPTDVEDKSTQSVDNPKVESEQEIKNKSSNTGKTTEESKQVTDDSKSEPEVPKSENKKEDEKSSTHAEPEDVDSILDLIDDTSDLLNEDLDTDKSLNETSKTDTNKEPSTNTDTSISDLITNAAVLSFNRIAKHWGTRYTNDTQKYDTKSNSTEFNIKGKIYKMPRSVLIELRRKGVSLTSNLLKAVTKPKENFKQVSVSEFIKESNNVDVNKAIISLTKSFNSLITQTPTLFKANAKNNPFFSVNGFINLYGLNEQGKLGLSNETKTGLFKAIIGSLLQQQMFSYQKPTVYTDYWNTIGSKWTISNTTEKALYGNEGNTNVLPEFDITTLGQDRSKFISMLGSMAIEQLGLEFNHKSSEYSDVVRDGLEQSIGIALLNIMMKQGLIQEHTVSLTKDDGSIHNIPYINFTSNFTDNTQVKLKTSEKVSSKTLDTLSDLKDEDIQDLFGEPVDKLRGVITKSKQEVIGSKNEVDTDNTNTKNKFGKSNSTSLKEGIAYHNNAKFVVNNRLYNMLKVSPDAVKAMLGFTFNVDNLKVSDVTKKSITSRNNAVERSLKYLNLFIDNAVASGIPQEDIVFEFNHRVVSNMRIMMDSTLSPQSNKIVREMLNLFQYTTYDSGETIEEELKLAETLPKSNEPRTIKDLVQSVTTGKGLNPEFSLSFMLALAQALDVGKLEKLSDNKIMEHLVKALTQSEHSEMLQKVIDGLWDLQIASENNEDHAILDNDTKKAMVAFGQVFGTSSPRAMNALSTLANFMYLGTDRDPHKNWKDRLDLDTSLNIESDGISNGGYNITRQFVSSISKNYLDTLKRTGNVTLDVLSQLFSKQINETSGTDLPLEDKIFGSSTMFGKESGKDELLDIYEVISNQLANQANDALRNVLNWSAENNYDLSKITVDNLKYAGSKKESMPKEVANDLRFLIQMQMTGHLKSTEPLTSVVFASNKNVALSQDFLLDVKRNLSKAGVTPKVYGSMVKGVAQQLSGDIKKQIQQSGDDVIDLVDKLGKTTDTKLKEQIKEDINSKLNSIKHYSFVLGIDTSKLIDNNLLKTTNSSDSTLKHYIDFINNINDVFANNTNVMQDNLKKGLANRLNTAVDNTFKEEFGNMQYSIIQDSFDFTQFISEFKANMQVAINLRNKRKGYSENDPRNADPLAKSDIVNLLKNITSTPAMATAFAQNAEMLEDVLSLGNAIIKNAYGSKQTQTTLSDSFENDTPRGSVNTLSNQLMSKYANFVAAGASNTTSTVPSTESKTQALLLRALRKFGLTSLDVFDGVEIPFMFRSVAGKLVNKATNEVHLSTNIFKAFYDRFKRSGIIDTILNPNTSGVSHSILRELNTKNQNLNSLFDSYPQATMNDIKYLLGISTLAQMKYKSMLIGLNETDINYDDINKAHQEVYRYGKVLEKARDSLLESEAKSVNLDFNRYDVDGVKLSRENPFNFLEVNSGSIQYQLNQLLNNTISEFGDKVAQNQAIKTIEAKYLPVIINQFGGGNRGYFFNKARLNDTGKRFVNFVENTYGSQYLAQNDLRLDSTALEAFLKSDPIIQKEYQKVVKDTYNRLNPEVTDTDLSIRKRIGEDKSNTFYEDLTKSSTINDVVKVLDNVINPNSVKGKYQKVILRTIQKQFKGLEEFNPNTMKVVVGRDNFIKWLENDLLLKPTSAEYQQRLNDYDTQDTTAGYFSAEEGIILIKSEKALTTSLVNPEDIDVLTHELTHAINHAIFAKYYSKDFQDELAKNPKLLKEDKDGLVHTIKNMEDIAVTFAKKFSTNRQLFKLLQEMNNKDGKNYHYDILANDRYLSIPVAIRHSANILYYFNQIDLNKPDTYPSGWNKSDVLEARRNTLDEFLAYSVSDTGMIEKLNVFKNTVTNKEDKSLLQSVIDMFKSLRKAFYNFIGLNEKDYPDSLATALMREYFKLGELDKAKFVNNKDTLGKSSLNFDADIYAKNSQLYHPLFSRDTTNKPRAMASANNSRIFSDGDHKKYLTDLGALFAKHSLDLLQTNGLTLEYEEGADVIDALKDNTTPSYITTLRSAGLNVSNTEEEVAKLLATGLKITETINPSLYSEALNIAEEIVSLLPALGLNKLTEKALLKLPANELLGVLATNKVLQTSLSKLSDKQLTKTQKLIEFLENKLVFGNKLLNDNLQVTLQQLAKQVMTFDVSNKLSISERIKRENKELEKEEQLLKAKEIFDEVAEKVGQPLHSIMEITSDVFSGHGLAADGSDADSAIGSLIREIIRNNELLNKRPTLVSKVASWFLGLDFKGGYVADLVGQRAFQTEAIRERMNSATSASIRKQFTDKLSEEQELAINASLMKTKLNNLKLDLKRFENVLRNTTERNKYIKEVQDKLSHSLVDLNLSQKQIDEAKNVYLWQLQGLAELNQTGYANGNEDSNFILPNINSILGSTATKHLLGWNKPSTDLVNAMKELYTLYSLNHINQDDLNVIADLAKEQPKGMKSLLEAVNTLEREMSLVDIGFHGKENFEMFKTNSNKDIVILPLEDTKAIEKYKQLGYSEKLNLDNDQFVVLQSNMSVANRFTTGVFGLAEETINGQNLLTKKSINEVSSSRKIIDIDSKFAKALQKAKKNSNYYNELTNKSIAGLTVNEVGRLLHSVKIELPMSIRKDLTDVYDEGIDAIANYHGRMMEEYATQQNNVNTIDQLNTIYEKSSNKKNYILFDGNYKPKSNSAADVEFANRVNNIYKSLPVATKLYIQRLPNGLHLDLNHINNLVGYHQASITDVFTGKSGLPEPVQKGIRSLFNVFGSVTGFNPIKSAKFVEQIVKEVTGVSRDFILNRSGVVAFGNLVSNFIHLWNTGIPVNKITPYMAEGLKEVKEYSKTLNKSFEVDYLRKASNLSKAEKARLDKQFELLTAKLNKSPVASMIQNGILTSVESIELKLQDNPDFSLIKQLQNKTGFTKFRQTNIGKIWGNVMVQEGSKTHDFMNQALDYGDFVAKYALFKHLTQNRQFSKERALRIIQDEFINYQLNRGREFDWLNATGLTWFLSYKLGIQKIIMRNLRRNFLRSVAVYEGIGSITNQVVPRQNLIWDGSLDYQLSPSNIYKGFESHWLMNATKLFD